MWCVSIGALVIIWIVRTSQGKESYIQRDLLAEEDTNNRHVIYNIGDGVNKERRQTEKNKDGEDDEEKKTLSQQVADGKYGLIQTELFSNAPVRPGIISYEVNPEVPKDNVNNLGGLQPEEIWLAENHLLVLGGGGYSEKESNTRLAWPPIDNYVAPRRQVKIPDTPKVPPPFPIQLKEGGPTEFIRGENGTGGPPPFLPFLDPRFSTFTGNFTGNATSSGMHSLPNLPFPGNYSQGNGLQMPPFPFFPPPSNESPFFPPPGLFPGLPPSVAFLPPPGNFSDQFDEDDPSIYYPPPYDFFYPRDNTTIVPPGPLVPGIVLPPPPDFFAPLLNKTKSRRPGTNKLKLSPPPKHGKYPPPRYFTSTLLPSVPQTSTPVYIEQVTTPKPYQTTMLPSLTTTVAQISVTEEQKFNEVKPNSIIYNDGPMQGWVPIPAPRPYYISQPNRAHSKDHLLTTPSALSQNTAEPQQGYIYNQPHQHQTPQRGWIFRNITKPALIHPESYYNTITQDSPKLEYDYFQKRGRQFVPSTPEPYNNLGHFQPIFVPRGRHGTTTIAPDTYYPTRSKIPKATYYFYEEPHISQAHLEDTDDSLSPTKSEATPAPHKIYYDTKHKIESKTPPVVQNDNGNIHSSPNPSQGQSKPIHQSYYEQGGYKPSTLGDTVNYYYHNESPKLYSQDEGYSYEKPNNSPLLSNIFQNNPDITNGYFTSNLNGKAFKPQSTSKKPPVYEYSYSAAGYNGDQYSHLKSPLLDVSESPTLVYQDNGTPVKAPKYVYYEYESSPKTSTKNYYNYKEDTSSVIPTPGYQTTRKTNSGHRTQSDYVPRLQNNVNYYTTSKPGTNQQGTNSIPSPHTTNNPYHAFFTHHDEPLLDDITKKYFTIFGQKINQGDVGEPVTTPLPAVSDTSTQKQYIDSSRPQINEGTRQNVKFPTKKQPVYSDDSYTTPAPPYEYNSYAAVRLTGNRPAQRSKYPSAYFTTSPNIFNSYNNYGRAQGSHRPTDLASDILVNYRNPLPPINPDAEIIDSAKLYRPRQRGSFISYRLPGNGDGHFYFLTPQSVSNLRSQVEDYDDDSEGYIYALPVRTRGFHSRDTPQHSRHRRRQHHQSRS